MPSNPLETSENRLREQLYSAVAEAQQQGADVNQILARSLEYFSRFESTKEFSSALQAILSEFQIFDTPEQLSAAIDQVILGVEARQVQLISELAKELSEVQMNSFPPAALVAAAQKFFARQPEMNQAEARFVLAAALQEALVRHADDITARGLEQPYLNTLIKGALPR